MYHLTAKNPGSVTSTLHGSVTGTLQGSVNSTLCYWHLRSDGKHISSNMVMGQFT